MSYKKLGLILIAVTALVLPACTRSATTVTTVPPSVTSGGKNAIVQPMTPNATQDPMVVLQQYATQTALAALGSPQPATEAVTPGTTVVAPVTSAATLTTPIITPLISTPATPTATKAALPTLTPAPRPATYTLKEGEFVYCIARRFNVDPDQLLKLNGLFDSQIVSPGLVLTIPSTGAFPGTRALLTHPATYTVLSGDTIYSVACKYGDVDPLNIAAVNGLSAPYTLKVGTSIQIP